MRSHTERETDALFDDALRTWARQGTATPGADAARQVMRRLETQRSWRRSSWVAAVAAAAVVTCAVAGLLMFTPAGTGQQIGGGTVVVSPSLSEGQVLIWLDEKTPLYMTLQAPSTGSNTGE